MNELTKLTKAELVEQMRLDKKELIDEKKRTYTLDRENKELKKEFEIVKDSLLTAQNKLVNIQQAVITAAAIKHPDAQIIEHYDQWNNLQQVRSTDETEDLLLLRHLHKLSV